jgi:hypothetical protein
MILYYFGISVFQEFSKLLKNTFFQNIYIIEKNLSSSLKEKTGLFVSPGFLFSD